MTKAGLFILKTKAIEKAFLSISKENIDTEQQSTVENESGVKLLLSFPNE